MIANFKKRYLIPYIPPEFKVQKEYKVERMLLSKVEGEMTYLESREENGEKTYFLGINRGITNEMFPLLEESYADILNRFTGAKIGMVMDVQNGSMISGSLEVPTQIRIPEGKVEIMIIELDFPTQTAAESFARKDFQIEINEQHPFNEMVAWDLIQLH